jgi:hypothetical protein
LSLKENIEMVREELNSEEKFFESAVKTERFIKKYKKPLIGAVSAIVVLVAGMAVYNASMNAKIEAANDVFVILQKDPADAEAAQKLKELDPALFDVWELSKAIASEDTEALQRLSSSQAIAVADIASYELAAITNDVKKLDAYAYGQNAIYRDLALVETAVLLMEKGNIDGAHEKLKMLAPDSAIYKVGQMLLHYGAK